MGTAPLLAGGVLWLYVVLTQVLLVNLLIAMMNTTYQRYQDDAEREYVYDNCRDLLEV